jgi:hypothetical protein
MCPSSIMPPGSTAIDWQALKPDILRLLSIGKTRKDVAQEISRDGTSITLVTHVYSFFPFTTNPCLESHNSNTSLSAGACEPTSHSRRGGMLVTRCKSEREARRPALSSSMALLYQTPKWSRKPGGMTVPLCSQHRVVSFPKCR